MKTRTSSARLNALHQLKEGEDEGSESDGNENGTLMKASLTN